MFRYICEKFVINQIYSYYFYDYEHRKIDDALPFVERLQFLTVTLSAEEGRPIAPLDLNWLLSRLYNRKYMPYLALASLSLDSGQDHSLQDAFHRIELFSRNSVGYGLFVKQ